MKKPDVLKECSADGIHKTFQDDAEDMIYHNMEGESHCMAEGDMHMVKNNCH